MKTFDVIYLNCSCFIDNIKFRRYICILDIVKIICFLDDGREKSHFSFLVK